MFDVPVKNILDISLVLREICLQGVVFQDILTSVLPLTLVIDGGGVVFFEATRNLGRCYCPEMKVVTGEAEAGDEYH
ncbi:hypothetical protein L1887_24311 [Cichorium endivia]|nr:hypothetical protein L1887_24311 [Cichorium endivia]